MKGCGPGDVLVGRDIFTGSNTLSSVDATSSDSSTAVDDESFLDLLTDIVDGDFDPALFLQ